MTERTDVGDGAEATDLVAEAFDASLGATANTESFILPILPSQKPTSVSPTAIFVLQWLFQTMSNWGDEFTSSQTLPTFEINPRPSV